MGGGGRGWWLWEWEGDSDTSQPYSSSEELCVPSLGLSSHAFSSWTCYVFFSGANRFDLFQKPHSGSSDFFSADGSKPVVEANHRQLHSGGKPVALIGNPHRNNPGLLRIFVSFLGRRIFVSFTLSTWVWGVSLFESAPLVRVVCKAKLKGQPPFSAPLTKANRE